MDINVKFLEDCDPQDGSKVFTAGTTARLNPASARHWTRRGKAVEITAKEIEALKSAKANIDAGNKKAVADKAKTKAAKSKK